MGFLPRKKHSALLTVLITYEYYVGIGITMYVTYINPYPTNVENRVSS